MNLKEFEFLCERCKETQENLLTDLVKRNADTAFGKTHTFDSVKTIDDFREKVPVSEWDDIRDYVKKMEDGEEDQLFPGKPLVFIITSGTTGKAKLLPESQMGVDIKKKIGALRFDIIKNFFPNVFEGKMLPLVNKFTVGMTSCGIPFGSASGITLMTASENIRKKTVFPFLILETDNPEAMDYLSMRFGVEHDVTFIAGNNAGRIEQLVKIAEEKSDWIIDDIRSGKISDFISLEENIRKELLANLSPNPKRANELTEKMKDGKLTPEVYWPSLSVINCWLAGSIGSYVKKVRNLFPNVNFFDLGYGASEGKFTIPLEPECPAGPLAIFGNFFEFTPLNNPDKLLLAHELCDGEMYEIFVTTYSGLYRYSMHDIVKVEGFTGSTPNIVFVSKSTDVANLCGEKVSPDSLEKVMDIISKNEFPIKHWCVVCDTERFCYNFCIEPLREENFPEDRLKKLAERIESELRQHVSHIYGVFRDQNLIKPATVTIMRSGWYEARTKEKLRGRDFGSQLKLPLVNPSVPAEHFILCSI